MIADLWFLKTAGFNVLVSNYVYIFQIVLEV